MANGSPPHVSLHTSDPGATSKPLSTDENGYIKLVRGYFNGVFANPGDDLVVRLGDADGEQKLIFETVEEGEIASLASDGIFTIDKVLFRELGSLASIDLIIRVPDGAKVSIKDSGDLEIASVDSDGKGVLASAEIGDDTNKAQFATNGRLTLTGTARVVRDLWIDAAGIKAPGAKPATQVSFGALEVSAWEFSDEGVEGNQESVSWRIAIPYDMDRSAGPSLRVGWSSASAGNCKWQLKYRWFALDEDLTLDGEKTLTATGAASTTANGLVITDITGIDAPSSTDATIMFKLTRLSADAADTISDTVELHGVCFSYVSNRLGETL